MLSMIIILWILWRLSRPWGWYRPPMGMWHRPSMRGFRGHPIPFFQRKVIPAVENVINTVKGWFG